MKAKFLLFAALLPLTACSDASIPDYLVEGRLPHFGKDQETPAATPAPVARAEPKPKTETSKPWFSKKPKAEKSVAAAPVAEPAPIAPQPASPAAPEVATVPPPVQPIAPVPQPQQPVAMAQPAQDPAPAPAAKPPIAKPKTEHSRSIFGHHASTADTPEPHLAGGYQKATDKAAIAAAAAFAVHESPGYVLKGIESARAQVVAGTNYALCLRVRTPGHEANPLHWRTVSAVVFQGLDQHYELTSWKEVNICPAE